MKFLRTTMLVSIFAFLVAATPALAITTDWFSNRTSVLNVFDAGPFGAFFGERPRLGAATSGFIEGTVNLPSVEDYLVQFSVIFDGNTGSDLTDFVTVFLDGVNIGDFTNDQISPISHSFNGMSFDYRFEFNSSNTTIGFHQVVNEGTISVSAVPVPAALPLFGTGLAVMGFIGWRRKRKLAVAT